MNDYMIQRPCLDRTSCLGVASDLSARIVSRTMLVDLRGAEGAAPRRCRGWLGADRVRLYPDDLRALLEELLGVVRKELLFCLKGSMLARALPSPQQSSRRSARPTVHHCTFLKGSSGLELTRACISQLCSSMNRCALQKSFPQSSHFPTMG